MASEARDGVKFCECGWMHDAHASVIYGLEDIYQGLRAGAITKRWLDAHSPRMSWSRCSTATAASSSCRDGVQPKRGSE